MKDIKKNNITYKDYYTKIKKIRLFCNGDVINYL